MRDFTVVVNDSDCTSVLAVLTTAEAVAPSIGVPLRETFNTTVPAAGAVNVAFTAIR